MSVTIVTVWLLASGIHASAATSPYFANQQSCEAVRAHLDYPKHFKCIQTQIYVTIPTK